MLILGLTCLGLKVWDDLDAKTRRKQRHRTLLSCYILLVSRSGGTKIGLRASPKPRNFTFSGRFMYQTPRSLALFTSSSGQ